MNPWILTPEKYLKEPEVKKLRKVLEDKAIVALTKKQKKPIRDWMIVDLALSSGLRASELGNIKIKDIYIRKSESSLLVRNGKADRSRMVYIGKKARKHLKDFLKWKKQVRESTKPDSCLFISERGDRMTLSAIQKRFKHWARVAGLDSRYSIHSTRHTYGTMLYKATKDLRLVQKQLGHSSSRITEIYADVLPEEAKKGVDLLYV